MKNLLKLAVILTIVISFSLNTFGQHQFGVKVSGGISQIADSNESSDVKVTTSFMPSWQGGFYYNLSLGKKSLLGAELLFSQIEGRNKWEMELMDNEGNIVGNATALFYRHISYLSLPVYYGFNIKKLTINAGFQISRALASSERINGAHDKQSSYESKTDNVSITDYDLGPRAGISYHLTDRLAIEGTYYYSINNIHKTVPVVWVWKVQQMTVGVRYALWSKSGIR